MTGSTAIEAMVSDGIVPLLSSGSTSTLIAAVEALAAHKLTTLEVTLRASGALEAFGDLASWIASTDVPFLLGAGTVTRAEQATAVIDLGARFVFSPAVVETVAAVCHRRGVPFIPGCATPTDVHRAIELGCDTVKLFPANSIGGPSFLRAVRAVFPDLRYIPSGGVVPDPTALRDWFEAGASAVAVGSQLFGARPEEFAESVRVAAEALAQATDRSAR